MHFKRSVRPGRGACLGRIDDRATIQHRSGRQRSGTVLSVGQVTVLLGELAKCYGIGEGEA